MHDISQQLEDLLQQCTVQITIPGQPGWGTGFFVAPGLILSCAHVIKALAIGAAAQIRWQQQADFATAELVQLEPQLDLALLQFTPANADLPCVYLDESLQVGQELYFFGYPDQDFDNGCPVTGSCEGFTGDVPPLIKFKQAQVRPGMSGSALLNRHTGKVCGMVKFTRDRSIDLGGGAISTRMILEQFPQLRDLQQEFHQRDRRWSHPLKQASKIDFQPYLESIAKTYAKWWRYYTLTEAESQQRQAQESAPIFDFGLMVRTVLKQEPEQPQQEKQEKEQVERFSVLEGLRKYALREKPEHLLLVGRPGSGKSTALARLMLEEATKPNARIPVLVELRYWQGSITQLILNALKRHDPSVTTEQLESVLTQSLLLFDGVNELPSEEARTQLSAFRRDQLKVPMIFTTRDLSLGGDLGIERKLEMQPLTASQMQAFIRAYIPEQAEAMLRQLKHRLWEFGQTPLLLWMLCEVFQQAPDNQLPSNLGGVFQAFSKMYEESSVRKHEVALLKGDVSPLSDRRLWKKALMAIAAIMMEGETPVDFRVAIHRDEAERELKTVFPHEKFPVRDILDDLLKYHLLQNRGVDQIEFRHQLIQEYYAAEYLLRILPTMSDEQLKREYLNYLKWTEPIALMLAMLEAEAQALRVVKLAMDEVDLMLGARLAGDVQPGFQATTVGWIDALEMPPLLRCLCWVTSQSEAAIPGLLQALEDQNSSVRRSAAKALGEIGSDKAIPGLRQALEDHDDAVRWNAANALNDLDSKQLTFGFMLMMSAIPILEKYEPIAHRVCKRAAMVTFEQLQKIPGLPKAVQNQDFDGWREVGDEFRQLGGEQAIPGLLKALEDQGSDVRWSVAQVLGNSGSEQAIPGLLKALEDQHSDVRGSAAEALGQLGSDEAIPGLLKALEDQHSNVRGSAAEALGKIGNSKPLAELWRQQLTSLGTYLYSALSAIQNRCKYYNHELAHNLLSPGKSIALYFSSAPGDAELQTQLANHLNLLERQEIITSWHHRQMLPGDDRDQVINDRLNSADIILLLISADSISDNTCYDIEINRAMERHQAGEARVIPILLRPVDWKGAPFSQLPVLPRNQQPVTSWGDRDAAFQEIAEGIRAVAIELRRTKGAGA